MDIYFFLALLVFFGTIFLFFFDKLDKTLVALGWAILLILSGVITPVEALKAIDIETLILLFGLMLIVGISFHSWLFSYVNMMIAKKSNGSPKIIFLMFIFLITFSSFVLNNATVVLLTVPIAIALARGLNLDGKLLVILLAVFSNIWGTLTLIWDPPNTLIGMKAGIPFMDFIYNLWIPISMMMVIIIGYLMYRYKPSFQVIQNDFSKIFVSKLIIERISYKYIEQKMDRYIATIAIITVIVTVGLLIFQPQISELTGIKEGMVGFMGVTAGIVGSIMVMKKLSFGHIMKEVEWDSLLFFAALFVQVGALAKVGFLDLITGQIAQFSSNLPLLLLVIIWGIGLASTIINNIPFVALMIPVIIELQGKMGGLYSPEQLWLLWWALALGACLGGNGTIVGSASGVIACDLAKKQGLNISFAEFAKVWMPITIISLVVSSIYILAAYYLY